MLRRIVCAGFLLLVLGPAHAQERPLPDLTSILKEVRKTLHSDRVLLSQYTYIEKNTEKSLDKKGNVTKTEVEVSEVYPSLEEGQSYSRLISKDGRAVDPKELEKKDREHQQKVLERARKLERERTNEKEKRVAKEAEERRKEDAVIDEVFRLYSFSLKGREVLDGHEVIVIDFRGNPDFKAITDGGKILKKFSGRAWINERDHELVRIEGELIDNVSIGFGVLAKLNKGAHAMFQRRLVNNEIWLPAEAHFTGSARVLLVKGMRVDASSEYSGYKKFSVDTATSFPTLPQ